MAYPMRRVTYTLFVQEEDAEAVVESLSEWFWNHEIGMSRSGRAVVEAVTDAEYHTYRDHFDPELG